MIKSSIARFLVAVISIALVGLNSASELSMPQEIDIVSQLPYSEYMENVTWVPLEDGEIISSEWSSDVFDVPALFLFKEVDSDTVFAQVDNCGINFLSYVIYCEIRYRYFGGPYIIRSTIDFETSYKPNSLLSKPLGSVDYRLQTYKITEDQISITLHRDNFMASMTFLFEFLIILAIAVTIIIMFTTARTTRYEG